MRVPEPRQHATGAREAERKDELPAQESERNRVEEQRALPAEPDHAALGFEREELPQVQIDSFHGDLFIKTRTSLSY